MEIDLHKNKVDLKVRAAKLCEQKKDSWYIEVTVRHKKGIIPN
jgi:hypothetical protein